MLSLRTVQWKEGKVIMVNQRKLPHELVFAEFDEVTQVANAIRTMVVRGAPAIGAAAALGLALAARRSRALTRDELLLDLRRAEKLLEETRPTAVNLTWALTRILSKAESYTGSVEGLKKAVLEEALTITDEDLSVNKQIVEHGSLLIEDGDVVLTHCNAGVLATVGYGTAQGVILQAHRQGKNIKVYPTCTAPLFQGARITMFELMREGVEAYLIADTAAGHVIRNQGVTKVLVGADRILGDGTTYNKIGTYQLAVLAARHGVPFYVVAPTSTVDMITKREAVVIEERPSTEVTRIGDISIAPRGAKAYNPAFDETPPELITAIVTEKGVIEPPFRQNLEKMMSGRPTGGEMDS